MKVKEYLATITDEFEKIRVCAEIARQHPEYEKAGYSQRKSMLKKILDEEIKEDKDDGNF